MKKNRPAIVVLLAWAAVAAIFFRGCRPVNRAITLNPFRVVAGVGDVTLHVTGQGFTPGMKVRVGEQVLPAAFLGAGELTCSLERASLLPKGSGATNETIAICVLDAQEKEFSDTAHLTLAVHYTWQPVAAPPLLGAGSGGQRLFALAGKTLLLVTRNETGEIRGVVSGDSGKTWGSPAVLHALEAPDGPVAFVAHPATGVAAVMLTAAGIKFQPLVGASGGAPALPAVVLPLAEATMKDLSAYCDRRGGLHVAWLDSSPLERFTFHYAFSADGGANWTEPRLVREVLNPQPGSYTLDYFGITIEGADGDGRILMTASFTYNFRGSSERMLSRDHGRTWTVAGTPFREPAGSAVSAAGAIILGGTATVGPYFPVTSVAMVNGSSDWENDWQERRFMGADWNPSQASWVKSLRGDRWDNLLLAVRYNWASDETQAQAYFRSTDAGATWGPAAPWGANHPMIKDLADLAIDAAGNAFALFRGGSGLQLFRAAASGSVSE